MSEEFDVEEFVRQFTGPAPARKPRPAARIMLSPPLPARLGPRLERSRSGRKRWTAFLDRETEQQRFTNQLPML